MRLLGMSTFKMVLHVAEMLYSITEAILISLQK